MDSNAQWLRRAQVVIGTGGTALEIDGGGSRDLRITFEITKTIGSTPNPATIKIYNLSPNSQQWIQEASDEVLLNVGYQNAMRLIFRGTIMHAFRYRDKADIIIQIEAGDGDSDYRNATLNLTLGAGTTDEHLINAALGSFKSTTKGHIGTTSKARIRGKVVSGMTRDALSALAREASANWSIQDGQLQIVPVNGVLPNQAIVINASTGMLKAPEITDQKGIKVTCLMNPAIGVNSVVKLDNQDIMRKRRTHRGFSKNTRKKKNDTEKAFQLDPDGLYKVIRVDHRGDTRGSDWQSEILCIGLSAPIPDTSQTPGGIPTEDYWDN